MRKRMNSRQTKLLLCALMLVAFGVVLGLTAGILLAWDSEEVIKTETETAEKPKENETADKPVIEVVDKPAASAQTEIIQAEQTCAAPAPETEPIIRDDIPLAPELQQALYDAAQYAGIPYTLALAVVHQESGYRNVMGDGGESYGYMQIQEKWHKDRMQKLGVDDLMDPYSNFLVGCTLLGDLLRNNDGAIHMALMAYNMGQAGAERCGKSESAYSRAVVRYMEDLENGSV